jgi:hypothetical protein
MNDRYRKNYRMSIKNNLEFINVSKKVHVVTVKAWKIENES